MMTTVRNMTNAATSNIVKTLARGYSEAMLDAEKRDVIISWSIPVEPLPKLK